ncbi:hypothetical protein ACIBCR_14755 [Micromonospora echinospora]|uniref:hypothetical protein n=1 Tax=Micromonospora echinospora TaxID=1877 RepID=UPI0037AD7554
MMWWYRWLRAWLSNTATLATLLADTERELGRARRALVVADDWHRAEMAAAQAAHRAETDRMNRRITELECRCAAWRAVWQQRRLDFEPPASKERANAD